MIKPRSGSCCLVKAHSYAERREDMINQRNVRITPNLGEDDWVACAHKPQSYLNIVKITSSFSLWRNSRELDEMFRLINWTGTILRLPVFCLC